MTHTRSNLNVEAARRHHEATQHNEVELRSGVARTIAGR